MDRDETQRIRDEIIAECQRIGERFVFGAPVDRSAVLDQAREQIESIIGQPCIARYEGDLIVVDSPVIRRNAI